MKVFKFGGASVKSAEALINLASIVNRYDDRLILVISAMGKTTNHLESVTSAWFNGDLQSGNLLRSIQAFHLNIAQALFPPDHPIYQTIKELFDSIFQRLDQTPSTDFDFEYDQVVSAGELLSTALVSAWLNESGIPNEWVDIRNCLRTGDQYRDAVVDWPVSERLMKEQFSFSSTRIYVTQGFIGGTDRKTTTTLGREGSDYSAAILTFLLDANQVVVWKDVAGIYNADPDYFSDAVPMPEISYREAIELAYYGARIIHPKTIKPLENKQIPLFVKSFIHPDTPGTVIRIPEKPLTLPPVYIVKSSQILLSVSPRDFSFIAEENLSRIFETFARHRIRINLTENSAISFSCCFDMEDRRIHSIIHELQKGYTVRYNERVTLITIRHYNDEAIARMITGREVLVEQRNRNTIRLVVKDP